ncbi:MAG: hypothetical protein GX852_00790, partial [Clostridiales bacterium]|nr:hypothetical protein [Clostridiales bacterium]
HRAWHDLILDTYVVDISEVKAAPTRVNAETPKCEELQVAPEKTEAVPTEVDPVEALDETSVEVVESESDNADK